MSPPAPLGTVPALEDLSLWTARRRVTAATELMKNISPNLTGFPKGFIIAAPWVVPDVQNYKFHWVRDAALVMNTVLSLDEDRGGANFESPYFEQIRDYLNFSKQNQLAPEPAGAEKVGLGEVKFNPDGSRFTKWMRPQNDGPALRAITVMRFARRLLHEGHVDLARHLYNGDRPGEQGIEAPGLIEADLRYIRDHWRAASFDPWEEVRGQHFYTRMVQRGALLAGARLALQLGDAKNAKLNRLVAQKLETAIETHWIAKGRKTPAGTVSSGQVWDSYGRVSGIDYKTTGLDMAVVLAAIHTHDGNDDQTDRFFSASDDRVLKTAMALARAFRGEYPLAQTSPRDAKVGTPIGRYPKDRYDGYDGKHLGNPWYLATAAFAELYRQCAQEWRQQGQISVTEINLEFLQSLSSEPLRVGERVLVADSRFKHLETSVLDLADSYLRRIQLNEGKDGHLTEQFSRDDGKPRGAENLTWSYASLLSAIRLPSPNAPVGNSDVQTLNRVIEHYTGAVKHLDPYSATYFNLEEDLDKFGDYPSPAYYKRAKDIDQTALDELREVHFESLPEQDRLTYRLFKEDLEVSLQAFHFPGRYLELNQMGSRLHEYIDSSSQTLTSFPFDSMAHYRAYLKRSMEFPRYVDRQIAILREGITKNIVLNCAVAEKVPNSYRDALEAKTESNPFYRPVSFMPKEFSDADRSQLKQEFSTLIRDRILPGYQKFDHFFHTEYLPHCRKGFGLKGLPNSDAWYRYQILASTNLKLDPIEVHRIGLREVARISKALLQIKEERRFKGTLSAFLRSAANDPNSFYGSSAEMFAAFEKVKAETALRVPKYFSLVPKSDFKIVETSNPEDAAGSYSLPTEMMPYGRFIVNTKNLRSVPIFGMTTLLLHETVPGHHFQLALQFEMKDKLSEYQRKIYGSNSFVEGWALYAEFLGNEMGMYDDPMQRFGNLNEEMLRAVRLVVDTGIHSLGWSQAKSIQYMREHLASDLGDIQNEVNRYSVWPGQALGYKIGQLKILELRRRAEKKLGSRFDIREFHESVIGHGTVSLGILETQVNDWIQQRLSTSPSQ